YRSLGDAFWAGRSVQLLDQDVPEPDRRTLRLPADRTAVNRGIGPAGHLDPIDLAHDGTVLAGHLFLVPLAHGLDRLLLRRGVLLGLALGSAQRQDRTGIGVHELDF